jgi:molybdopterin/thiamine biosynthesis adenylyltransferase
MSTGIVIIPRTLSRRVGELNALTGWFSGLKVNSEEVFVVLGAHANGRDLASNRSFKRLAAHRAAHFRFGGYEKELIEWRIVDAGLGESFRSAKELSLSEFEALFPTVLTGEPRVVVVIEASSTAGFILIAKCIKLDNQTVRLQPVDVTFLSSTLDPFARAPKTLVQAMAEKTVVIAGLGSGGAEIALNLAGAGLGRLTLVDPDRLGVENYFRFISGRSDLGRKKVDIVRSEIEDRELPTEVVAIDLDIVESANEFRGLLAQAPDLLVCATDSIASRRTANANAVFLNVPCLISGTLDEGRISEVLLVSPGRTPCYECIRLALGTTLQPSETDDRSATPYVGSESESVSSSALRSDIALTASLATRAALSVLLPSQFAALPASYVVWGREADTTYGPPFRFDLPMATNFFSAPRREDCPVCGAVATELRGIDCAAEAQRILANVLETGG